MDKKSKINTAIHLSELIGFFACMSVTGLAIGFFAAAIGIDTFGKWGPVLLSGVWLALTWFGGVQIRIYYANVFRDVAGHETEHSKLHQFLKPNLESTPMEFMKKVFAVVVLSPFFLWGLHRGITEPNWVKSLPGLFVVLVCVMLFKQGIQKKD